MLKKVLVVAGLIASLLATNAWAENVHHCIQLDGQYLVNTCGTTIEAAWCANQGCDFGRGGSWTLQPGQRMPHSLPSGSFVRFDACRGASSIKSFSTSGVTCR